MAAAPAALATPGGGRVAAGGRYVYRVPASVPYWSGRTLAAIAGALLGGRVRRGPHTGRLRARLAELFEGAEVVPCGSGRVAIELALRALGVGAGDEVVVPTFCCRSIMPPILALGATPVLADAGPDLNVSVATVDAALTTRTRAVIVPHLFGNPADVDGIEALCRPRGIAVIDDAAQALGATRSGRPVGAFGSAGIVSFGRGKVCFGTGGGALVTADTDVAARAASVTLTTAPAGRAAVDALSVLVWRRWRRVTLPALRLVSRFSRPPGRAAYRREAMRNIDAAVALTLLATLPDNVRARRARVARYRSVLEGCEGVDLVPHGPGSACLTQVVRVAGADGDRAAAVLARLRASGVEADRSYRPLHLMPAYARFARRPLTRADSVWTELVELPCEPSVRLDTVEAIARTVRQVLP
ncbi:MAG TPA: DegT/DnrJ/EryC1/StrS family aminotransferase [Candidatus Tectomicrobia bacterium]|nr:DegT/DnrJ/EryC1/StrS family aminotransferase [Candidatus Tectomicrobia bacterium]